MSQLERYEDLLVHLKKIHPSINVDGLSDEDAIRHALIQYDADNSTSLSSTYQSSSLDFIEGLLVGISTHIDSAGA